MASLQARSPLRSAHPLIFINKIISLTAFLLLLGVGWIALSYFKTELATRSHGTGENISPAKSAVVRANETDAPQIKQQPAPVRLIYSCAGDSRHYHTARHLPQGCERTLLSEEAALQRGLKRCNVCMPE